MNNVAQAISEQPNSIHPVSPSRSMLYPLEGEMNQTSMSIENHQYTIQRAKREISDAREEIKILTRTLKRQQERLAKFHDESAQALKEKS